LSSILGSLRVRLNAFYKGSCYLDLVEYWSSPNHDNARNDFDSRLAGETELSIVELECSSFCEELEAQLFAEVVAAHGGSPRSRYRLSSCTRRMISLIPSNKQASVFRVHLTSACEKRHVFALAYDAAQKKPTPLQAVILRA
jgi:hypothetical protein